MAKQALAKQLPLEVAELLLAPAPIEASPVNPNLPNFDRLIHEHMRLRIISALAANEWITFNDLKKILQTTDGNVSVHTRKLEDAGYIETSKSFEGRLPKTRYHLTEAGRAAFNRYLDHMEALIRAMREPAAGEPQ